MYAEEPMAIEALLELSQADRREITIGISLQICVIIASHDKTDLVDRDEDFIHANDAVKDVAVIGLPDNRLGEIACAVVELKPGVTCTEDELRDYCAKLPRYKRPRKYIFADVPRNATGKIDKPLLRERYGSAKLVAKESTN